MVGTLGFFFLMLNPEVSRLREHVEYLRAAYDDEHEGGEFVFGLDDRTPQSTFDLIETWPGAKVVPITWTDDFSAARNEVLSHVKSEWAVYFDPDELPSHHLLWWIREHVKANPPQPEAFLFWFRSFFGGTNLRLPETEADWHIRMFRKEHARFYRPIHELVAIKGRPEHDNRHQSRFVQKAPQRAFVIHAKPPHLIDEDDQKYAAIERAAQETT